VLARTLTIKKTKTPRPLQRTDVGDTFSVPESMSAACLAGTFA